GRLRRGDPRRGAGGPDRDQRGCERGRGALPAAHPGAAASGRRRDRRGRGRHGAGGRRGPAPPDHRRDRTHPGQLGDRSVAPAGRRPPRAGHRLSRELCERRTMTDEELTATGPAAAEPGIVLVPHTHWDREWYEPHEVFRLRLVHVLDDVITRLETDPEFCFTLDGQTAAIEDYLQIRPEMRERVTALVRAGRLAIGPFLILLDEFCCDGETIVRNLELGIDRAERLGGAMGVGYLPDMFGHTAQMPQILRGFGIEHAALWRGVPAAVTEHAFTWRAPDGSAVRTEYLFDGYGSALDLFAPGRLAELATAYREETRSWYGDDPVLGMFGTDHMAPPPELMDTVRAHNQAAAAAGAPTIQVATLADYLTSSEGAGPVVTGELRSHARGNLLPGVFSIRTNLKAAMARAELTLT